MDEIETTPPADDPELDPDVRNDLVPEPAEDDPSVAHESPDLED